MPTIEDQELRGDEDQAGADRVTKAKERQGKQDADTAAYNDGSPDRPDGDESASPESSFVDRLQNEAQNNPSDSGGFVGGLINASKNAGSMAARNKNKIGIGGGIAGLLTAMIFGVVSLLPLKIESMMKNMYGDHMGRVENAVQRRATKFFIRYALANKLSPGGGIVATGSPLTDLYATWRTQNFEKTLTDKYGLKIERRTGGRVRITTPQGTKDFASAAEYENFLDKDLTGRESRQFIISTIRSETKWHQVLKRHHLRKWMFNAYGIRKWKIFDNKKGEEAKTNLDTNLRENTMGEYRNRLSKSVACIFGDATQCPDKAGTDSGDLSSANEGKAATAELNKGVEEAAKVGTKAEINQKIAQLVGTQTFKKAVPIIGWIDLGARMDKLVWDNTSAKIVKNIRKAQYASVFASWLVVSDQIKDGKIVSGDEVNAAMLKLTGSEKSNASQRIYSNNPSGGERVSNDDLFSTKELDISRQVYMAATGQPILYHDAMRLYLGTIGKVYDAFGNFLSALLTSIPGLGALISDFSNFVGKYVMKGFMAILGPVLTGNETGAQLMNAIDVGADVTGNDFNESIGAQQLSGLSLRQTDERVAAEQAALDRSKGLGYQIANLDNPRSVASRLIAILPYNVNSGVRTGLYDSLALIGSPFNGMLAFAGRASTLAFQPTYAETSAISGQYTEQFGFTDEQLNRDIDEAGLTKAADWAVANRDPAIRRADGTVNASLMIPTDCDLGSAKPIVPNMCKLDLTTIQALKSVFTTDDDGGFGGTATSVAPDTGLTGAVPGAVPSAPGQIVPDVDTSALQCPIGADAGTGTVHIGQTGKTYKIRLCTVQGVTVNAPIAKSLNDMMTAAKAAGLKLSGYGYRTYERQIELRIQNGCPDVFTSPAKTCSPDTARPGFSNHEDGYAVDWSNNGVKISSRSSIAFRWLDTHAASYGFKNLPSEEWHWSINGK